MNWKKGTKKVSEQLDDELLSVVVVQGAKYVVCGTQEGIIAIYKASGRCYKLDVLGSPSFRPIIYFIIFSSLSLLLVLLK